MFQLEQTANIKRAGMQLDNLGKRRHHEDRRETNRASVPKFSHHQQGKQRGGKGGRVGWGEAGGGNSHTNN